MGNKKGEIATFLTLGLVLVGAAITFATSYITNQQKNIASNPQAQVDCTTNQSHCAEDCGSISSCNSNCAKKYNQPDYGTKDKICNNQTSIPQQPLTGSVYRYASANCTCLQICGGISSDYISGSDSNQITDSGARVCKCKATAGASQCGTNYPNNPAAPPNNSNLTPCNASAYTALSDCVNACGIGNCESCKMGTTTTKYHCTILNNPPANLKDCSKPRTYASEANCKAENGQDAKCTQCLVDGVVRIELDGTGPSVAPYQPPAPPAGSGVLNITVSNISAIVSGTAVTLRGSVSKKMPNLQYYFKYKETTDSNYIQTSKTTLSSTSSSFTRIISSLTSGKYVFQACVSENKPKGQIICANDKSFKIEGAGSSGGVNVPQPIVPGGGVQCSALNQCPNSSQKYVEGTITTTSGSLTMYYSTAASCTNNTAAKQTVNEICYSAGSTAISCTTGDTSKKYYVKFVSGSTNIYSDAGYTNNVGTFTATGIQSYCTGPGSQPPVVNPPQSFVKEGTCIGSGTRITFGACNFFEKSGSQDCSNSTPIPGTQVGCSIYRVCGGTNCRYDCYQNGDKKNCVGAADPQSQYDFIRIVNISDQPIVIGKIILEKMRLGGHLTQDLGGVTLNPGAAKVINLNDLGKTYACDAISANSVRVWLFNPDGSQLTTAQDGCGGGVKILINLK